MNKFISFFLPETENEFEKKRSIALITVVFVTFIFALFILAIYS